MLVLSVSPRWLLGQAVGLVAAVLGAAWLWRQREPSRRRMSIAALVGGLVTLTTATVMQRRALYPTPTFSMPYGALLLDDGTGARVARLGDTWGLLWIVERGIGRGSRLGFTFFCRDDLYFDLFDDALHPKLPEPVKIGERPCGRLEDPYALVATSTDFVVLHQQGFDDLGDGGELRMVSMDPRTGRPTKPRTLVSLSNAKPLAMDPSSHLFAVAEGDRVHLAVRRGRSLQILAARPGEAAVEELSFPTSDTYDPPRVHGTFAGPTLVAWVQGSPAEVVYAFSADGRHVDGMEVLRDLWAKPPYSDVTVLRRADEIWLLIATFSDVWRQRFDLQGKKLGAAEQITRAAGELHRFDVARVEGDCLVRLAMGTHAALRVSLCDNKLSGGPGGAYVDSLGCAGSTCLHSGGGTVHRLDAKTLAKKGE
jgi:hypothetical protein